MDKYFTRCANRHSLCMHLTLVCVSACVRFSLLTAWCSTYLYLLIEFLFHSDFHSIS